MLGSPTATASLLQSSATASTTTPSSRPPESERDRRSSRLRGLSYRFTNHLHSSRSSEAAPQLSRSTSSPGIANTSTTVTPTPARQHRPSVRRSITSTNTSTSTTHLEGVHTIPVSPARIESGENGWIPTVQGRSLSREPLQSTSTFTASATPEASSPSAMMTRNRSATAVAVGPAPTSTAPPVPPIPRTPSATIAAAAAMPDAEPESSPAGTTKQELPTIRFIPHLETRSSRPSLHFTTLSRTLKTPNSVIRVGRYSERDSASGEPNSLPVGFKSKVVSRRHCEFWCTDGQWYIRDVKSSSGTFLNHVRLSSPGQESRPYPVNDGDVVQLGIDFKGGEEVIFRCVKIRVECNRGWQKGLNSFNTTAHKRLLKNALRAKTRDSDAASVNSSECSICLNPVAPCQALFVAPCSHVWHYKCIRNLVHGPHYPNFICPNCRFVADLEADVEQPEDDDLDDEVDLNQTQPAMEASASSDENTGPDREIEHAEPPIAESGPRAQSISRSQQVDEDLAALLDHTALSSPPPQPETSVNGVSGISATSGPMDIAQANHRTPQASDPLGARSMTPESHTQFALAIGPIADGPLTPRNDAGPFVLTERLNGATLRPSNTQSGPRS